MMTLTVILSTEKETKHNKFQVINENTGYNR